MLHCNGILDPFGEDKSTIFSNSHKTSHTIAFSDLIFFPLVKNIGFVAECFSFLL
jgi:hypothetical protein